MSRSCMVRLICTAMCLAPLVNSNTCQAQSPTAARDRSPRWSAPRRPLPVRTVVAVSNDTAGTSQVAQVNAELETSGSLPNDQGQVWREYDIADIAARLAAGNPNNSKPEQAIVDWILRETGTDVWFGEPLGLMNASDQKLKVYHTPAVQSQVAEIVNRFTQTDAAQQAFAVRLVTLTSPNWRAKAAARMIPVSAQTPGVEAWLISREDAAIILEQIRRRSDYRELTSPNRLIQNGQTHVIQRRRPMAYVRGMRAVPNAVGGYQMEMGQVDEGFTLAVSPLLSHDRSTVDAVIKLETTQIEKMTSMSIPTPTITNQKQTSPIQVPQTSSWRLHERFHWPADQLLVISCGVIADPGPQRGGMLGLPVPGKPARADALLFVEAKGRYQELIAVPQAADTAAGMNYRGRY